MGGIRLRKMDSLDIRIIRNVLESSATSPLDANVRKSLSSIARRLDVDENTVKNRIQGLKRSGFLKGWWVAINPNLVGQKMAQIWFDVGSSSAKQEVIKKVSLIPGVAVIKDLFGPSLCMSSTMKASRTSRRRPNSFRASQGLVPRRRSMSPFQAVESACRATTS